MINIVIYRRGRTVGVLLLISALFSAGCNTGRKPVYPVEGRVLVNGKAAPRAIVTFNPVGDTSATAVRPVGHADETGKFTLTTYTEADGAPAGDYDVTLTWYLATRASNRSDDYVSNNYLPDP